MSDLEPTTSRDQRHLDRTTEIVAAYVGRNAISAHDLPKLIADVHSAVTGLAGGATAAPAELKPAVPIRSSIKPHQIICLDDGKGFTSLKRHLRGLGMTPDEYRKKWGLPRDYPMVAPNYSARRSQLAKDFGLGRTSSRAN